MAGDGSFQMIPGHGQPTRLADTAMVPEVTAAVVGKPAPSIQAKAMVLGGPITIPLPYGTATLAAGTPVKIVSESRGVVTVRTVAGQEFAVRRDQLR